MKQWSRSFLRPFNSIMSWSCDGKHTKCRPADMLILMSPLFYLSREHWKQFAKESPIRRSNAIFAFTQVVILFVNMNIKMKHYLP